jgi:hypothetical protein
MTCGPLIAISRLPERRLVAWSSRILISTLGSNGADRAGEGVGSVGLQVTPAEVSLRP